MNQTRRQKQAIETKKRILEAALELMDINGFQNTTIEQICKKAGVSVGAFYHYYASKSVIFEETFKEADEYFESEVAPELTDTEAFARLRIFFQHYAQFNKNKGIEHVRHLYNSQNELFIDRKRYMLSLLEEIIAYGQETKQFTKVLSVPEIQEHLMCIARGVIYDWCLHNAGYDLEERMGVYFSRFITVISKRN
jgi:AcrR family transcriptional regulator